MNNIIILKKKYFIAVIGSMYFLHVYIPIVSPVITNNFLCNLTVKTLETK